MKIIFCSISLFLVGSTLCSAFTNLGGPQQGTTLSIQASISTSSSSLSAERSGERSASVEPSSDFVAKCWRRAAVTAASMVVATTLTMVQPTVMIPAAFAAQPTLQEAIVEVSETSYPILKALDSTNFKEFSTKIGDLLLRINPDKLGKSIELGIDALDSAPPEKIAAFNAILAEAYTDVSVDSCKMVPLPPMAVVDKFAAVAAEKVNPDKLKAFEETWKPSLEALKKTDESICLPPSAKTLDRLALAQAELGSSYGKAEMKAFGSYTGPILKQTITPGKALSFVNDAKTLAPTASSQAKKDFANAGKKVEQASQLQMARDKIADQKAKKAANMSK